MSESQLPGTAYCKSNAAGTAFLANWRFNTLANGGAGIYTVKSDQTINVDQYKVAFGILGGAANANIQVTTADGLTWNITTFVIGVATNEIWWLELTPVTF